MRKLVYIFSIILLFNTSCTKDSEIAPATASVAIKLQQDGFSPKLVDEDNLESEQLILNLTIMFTEPSSNVFTHKFVNAGYTDVDDYKLVTLPLDLSELNRKDIYVITNYGNASFNALSTLDDLKEKQTPVSNKNNLLEPQKGFCMYGKTYDFDFNNETHSPAIVYAVRTCAKYRITLTFPENPTLSTSNSFLITNAANYTYIMDDTGNTIPSDAYFNFPKQIDLTDNGAGAYVSTAYIYEATKAPQIYIYTHMNNSSKAQEFSADLPVPQRNYLYDIDVRIYESQTKSLINSKNKDAGNYRYETNITVFDEQGNLVEYL